MKYAKEVLDLMSAFPGREWRMAELVRDASGGRELARRERDAMRQAILRVLEALQDCGQVQRIEYARNSLTTPGARCDTSKLAPATDHATIPPGHCVLREARKPKPPPMRALMMSGLRLLGQASFPPRFDHREPLRDAATRRVRHPPRCRCDE